MSKGLSSQFLSVQTFGPGLVKYHFDTPPTTPTHTHVLVHTHEICMITFFFYAKDTFQGIIQDKLYMQTIKAYMNKMLGTLL